MNDKIKAILSKINEEPLLPPVVELETVKPVLIKTEQPVAPIIVLEAQPVVRTITTVKKTKVVKNAVNTDGTSRNNREGVGEETSTNKEDGKFLGNLVNEAFSYEKRKYAFIEPRLFELFMQVKIKKDIKNISVIVNTILNEYVDKHQDEIRKLLENRF
jgi:hypothetical protein